MESKINEKLKEYRGALLNHQRQAEHSQQQIILLQGAIQALEDLTAPEAEEADVQDV
jgi:hypothetical protein